MKKSRRFKKVIALTLFSLLIVGFIDSVYSLISFQTVHTISTGQQGRSILKRNRFTGELLVFDCATTGRMGGCLTRKP